MKIRPISKRHRSHSRWAPEDALVESKSLYRDKPFDNRVTEVACSFALMEVNLILAKLFWKYDMELVNQSLDWEGQSKVHVMWSKPELRIRFHPRPMK